MRQVHITVEVVPKKVLTGQKSDRHGSICVRASPTCAVSCPLCFLCTVFQYSRNTLSLLITKFYLRFQSTPTKLAARSFSRCVHILSAFPERSQSFPVEGTRRCFPSIDNTLNMTTSRIVTLANEIQANTVKLDKYLEKNNLPRPSFDADAPLMYQLPPDVAAAQEALTAGLDELYWLNQGPIQLVVAKSVSASLKAKSNNDGSSNLVSLLLRSVLGLYFVITFRHSFHLIQERLFKSWLIRPRFR